MREIKKLLTFWTPVIGCRAGRCSSRGGRCFESSRPDRNCFALAVECYAEGDETSALQELAACMTPMIRQLPPAYREAITLPDLEGVNQAEAAARAGVSVLGMKSRIQRGRKQLKAVLEECCRVHLDRRGTIVAYDHRTPTSCSCGNCD